jgi:hypothetical protein
VESAHLDQRLRHHVYSVLAQGAPAPDAAAMAAALGVPEAEVRAGLERLHAGRALVLDAATRQVRMALPFSAVPTAYRVEAGDRRWSANCAWDAVAIARLLRLQEARLVDEGGGGREARTLTVAGGELAERDGVIALPRPAWRWWEDIVFT